LGPVNRVFVQRADGIPQWQAGFSADGNYLVYSSASRTLDAGETLYALNFNAPQSGGAARIVATDASRWRVSADSRSVYFLHNFNYSTTTPTGTLTVADFPGGDHLRTLSTSVTGFSVYPSTTGDALLLLRTQPGPGTLLFMPEVSNPARVVELGTSVVRASLSASVREVAYATFSGSAEPVYYVRHSDGSNLCAIGPVRSVVSTFDFSPTGRFLFWTQIPDGSEEERLWYALPEDCRVGRLLASGIDSWALGIDDATVVYSQRERSTGTSLDLSVCSVDTGLTTCSPRRIADQVDEPFSLVTVDGRSYVVFSRSTGESQGLYVTGPVSH
jgi:hypothetical protein